ncbi:MAG: DUF488 domain-containing protein [Scytonema sp. PMC 1069.18]|nr:DUF488 domain-containing protein [Scytonema sp. PMC 1069.18]MEC4886038.1 DUF488 domain-containing protein [Scytonema sp. PMC 1070.18]
MICQNKISQPYILTFGYGNRKSHDDFLKYLDFFEVSCVVDVRLSPRAWSRMWYGKEIEKLCHAKNIKYISKPSLGNTSGNKNWIPPNGEEATKALLEISEIAQTSTTLLLCAEIQHTQCHRVDVAQELQKLTKTTVKHLD